NVLDGDLSTRWSSSVNGATLTLELTSFSTVTELQIAAFVGDTRKAYFDLESSEDGTTWSSIGSYETSGLSLNLQSFDIPDQTTNYIRIKGFGNSSNGWNSFTELKLIGIQ
ncbi:MAG: discoidin domain-containing protein, partial [Lentisphaeraceae bacterium]|nr:discoidin domain-containing protein [Lentisphaeraceae bacterium]